MESDMHSAARRWWIGAILATIMLFVNLAGDPEATVGAQAPAGIQVTSSCNNVSQGAVSVAVGATLSCVIVLRNTTDRPVSLGSQVSLFSGGSGRLYLVSPFSVQRLAGMDTVRTQDTRAANGPMLIITCASGPDSGCVVPPRVSSEISVTLEAAAAGTAVLSLVGAALGVPLQPAITITAGLPGQTPPGPTPPPTALTAAKTCYRAGADRGVCTFTITLPAGTPAETTLTVVMTGNGVFAGGAPLDVRATGCAAPATATPLSDTSYRILLQTACSAGAVIAVTETVNIFAAGTLSQTVSSSRGGSASAGALLPFGAGRVAAINQCKPAGAENRYDCTLTIAVLEPIRPGTVIRVALSGPATFVPGSLDARLGGACQNGLNLVDATATGFGMRMIGGCSSVQFILVTASVRVSESGTLVVTVDVPNVDRAETAVPVTFVPSSPNP